VAVSSPEVAQDCSARILGAAVKQGAELLVGSCPLCQYNLDRAQREVHTGRARPTRVPVLYFSQLLAIALGCDEACLHLDDHGVDPRPLLSKWLEQKSQVTTLA
jgi:heterodisulfide reductase subunit B